MDRPGDLSARLRHGEGVPRGIRFRRGVSLGPFSVGSRGTWRVVGSGVRELHASLRFDGKDVSISAIDSNHPPLVDGRPIGSSWHTVEWPSIITMGDLRIVIDILDQDDLLEAAPFDDGESSEVTQVVDASDERCDQEPRAAGPVEPVGDVPFDGGPQAAHGEMPTRVVDLKSMFAAGGSPSPAPEGAPASSKSGPGLSVPLRSGWVGSFRKASLPKRIVAILLPLTVVLFAMRTVTRRTSVRARASTTASTNPRVYGALSANTVVAPAPAQPSAEPSAEPRADASQSSPAAPSSLPPQRLSTSTIGSAETGATGNRTRERQAADLMSSGDTAGAIRLYRELADAHPERPAFREAARVLQERAARASGATREP